MTATHTAKPESFEDVISVKPEHLLNEHDVPATGVPSDSSKFFRPGWLAQGQKVTALVDDDCQHGHLPLSKENL